MSQKGQLVLPNQRYLLYLSPVLSAGSWWRPGGLGQQHVTSVPLVWEGVMWDPKPWLHCSSGETSREAPGHILHTDHQSYLLAGSPREPHYFSSHVWVYRWHWHTLKQFCMDRRAELGDFPTFFLPSHSMISHHATHRGSQFLPSPLWPSWSEKTGQWC